VVSAAPPNDPLPPVPGADGPVADIVLPTDVAVTIPAGQTSAVSLLPSGARFAVVDAAGAAGQLTLSAPDGAPPVGGPLTTGPDGVVSVTPADGFTGVATFVVANPLALASTATVTVTVVGNAPPAAADDARTVTLGQVTTFAATELLGNDRDPDGDQLRVVAVRGATNGETYLNASGTVFVVPSAVGVGEAEVVVADTKGALATSMLRLTVGAAPTPPGAPTGLVGTPGDGRVMLDWQAPASSEPILGYEVQTRPAGGEWGASTPVPLRLQAVLPGATSTAAVVDGLVNGTTYEFRVAARSSLGLGGFSSTVLVTPAAAAMPPQPTVPPPPRPPAGGLLPSTGNSVADLLVLALALLAVGGLLRRTSLVRANRSRS
jgi:hypothetical protein